MKFSILPEEHLFALPLNWRVAACAAVSAAHHKKIISCNYFLH
jgi:hypothetical protein